MGKWARRNQQPLSTVPSIRLTPIYARNNHAAIGPAILEASAELFPLPVGRKELATTWWNGCPKSCHVGSPQCERVCERHCAALFKNHSILSRCIIDSSVASTSDTPRLQVHPKCRYPNLLHLDRPAAAGSTQHHSSTTSVLYDVRIGDDVNRPWMRFRAELLTPCPTNATGTRTPQYASVPTITPWVTDDGASHGRKRRRSEDFDASSSDNECCHSPNTSNSSKRQLFVEDGKPLQRRLRQQHGDIKKSVPARRSPSPGRKSLPSCAQSSYESDSDLEDDVNVSSGSAQRCLNEDCETFSTQLRPTSGLNSVGPRWHPPMASSNALAMGRVRPLVKDRDAKQDAYGNGREVNLQGDEHSMQSSASKTASNPIKRDRQRSTLGSAPASAELDPETIAASFASQQVFVGKNAKSIACMDATSQKQPSGAVLDCGDDNMAPLSFLSLPQCDTSESSHRETEDSAFYEETQVKMKQSIQQRNEQSARSIERRAVDLTLEEWKALQAKGTGASSTVSAFSKAMIDLIVAKQDSKLSFCKDGASGLWLPPLMDSETVVRL